jgi:hypothetical protein
VAFIFIGVKYMNMGWIKLHRQIREHWIWQDPIKFKWWVDILLTVNHKDSKVNLGNQLYECKRGQTILSLQGWADRWKVSKDTARNFLKLLEKDNMILHESLQKTTRITICNFESYQSDLHDSQTQTKRKRNDKQTTADPNKNEEECIKNEKEKKKEIAVDFFSVIDMLVTEKEITNEMAEVVKEWVSYKTEKKDMYKSERTLRAFVKTLLNDSNSNHKYAQKMVTQSIANQWKGVFQLKNEAPPPYKRPVDERGFPIYTETEKDEMRKKAEYDRKLTGIID